MIIVACTTTDANNVSTMGEAAGRMWIACFVSADQSFGYNSVTEEEFESEDSGIVSPDGSADEKGEHSCCLYDNVVTLNSSLQD